MDFKITTKKQKVIAIDQMNVLMNPSGTTLHNYRFKTKHTSQGSFAKSSNKFNTFNVSKALRKQVNTILKTAVNLFMMFLIYNRQSVHVNKHITLYAVEHTARNFYNYNTKLEKMGMINKVALVTGSNQGLGFATVKELLRRVVRTVYITAMTEQQGHEAMDKLTHECLTPHFHQLDITDSSSVKKCADHVKRNHGGLDILINNAGVAVKDWMNTTYEDSVQVLDTNYYGLLKVQEHFFPILNQNARVINISSNCGHISNLRNKEWISRLTKKDVKKADVDAFVEWFLESIKTVTWKPEDFFQTQFLAYRISKIAVSALTVVQQREIDRNISINSLYPGFIQSPMTRGSGVFTADEAAKVPVFLALDVHQLAKGQFFWHDKQAKDWRNPDLPLYCHFDVFA